MSIRQACGEANIHHKQFLNWRSELQSMSSWNNSKAKSLCVGRASCLADVQDELLRYIFEQREQGIGVSTTMVIIKATSISRDFKSKSPTAQYHSARRFVKSHGFVHRMATHESQRNPLELVEETSDFLNYIRPKLKQPCRDMDYIMNMDQTPIPFTYNSKRTLELVGVKTVHVIRSTNDTKRATCAMTVTASGKILKPFLVFKGKPGARIEQREFPSFSKECFYACQDNAWMDEGVMLLWIEKVLKPHVFGAPENIVPILFLDSYRCHMMASVVEKIQDLGVEVEHIPGGCTGLCQPVDVGVNKPLKDRLRRSWLAWMTQDAQQNGTVRPPTRGDISTWLVDSVGNLSHKIVKNSWRHTNYSWFDDEDDGEV